MGLERARGAALSVRVGFATSEEHAELIDDDRLAARELERRGATVRPLVWSRGDRGADLEVVVVRSCWDYHLAPDAFRAWVASIEAPRVVNAKEILAWNLDKAYLGELAARGATVPRTTRIGRGSRAWLARAMDELEAREVVVKPAISLTAFRTHRVARADAEASQAALDAILADGDALVQELVPEVLTEGELSFVFFGGAFSHAVRKRPKPGDFRVQSDFGGTREPASPDAAAIAKARAILGDVPAIYARVDVVPRGDELVVMELELLDPVLFFALDPRAPARFADALGIV